MKTVTNNKFASGALAYLKATLRRTPKMPTSADVKAFDAVQAAERDQIKRRRDQFGISSGRSDDTVGIALSGGGIRSATLCLGILQHLADKGLLKHLDYISTVSGGGYIGSWLCSWILRQQKQNPNPMVAFDEVSNRLKPIPRGQEPTQITFLRQYSNYLTPRFSVFSADTWVAGAIWLRNSLLNLALLVAFFSSVVLVVRALAEFIISAPWPDRFNYLLPFLASFLFFLPSVGLIAFNLNRQATALLHNTSPQPEDNYWHRIIVLASALISAVFYSLWLRRYCHFVEGSFWQGIETNFVSLFFCSFAIHCASRVYECRERMNSRTLPVLNAICSVALYVLAPAAVAFVTASLLRLIALLFDVLQRQSVAQQGWFVFVLGPVLVMSAFAIGMALHVGLMGRDLPESSREWIARLGAMLIMLKAMWLGVAGTSIYGPWLVLLLGVKSTAALGTAGAGWLTTTVASVFAGKSAKTSGDSENANQERSSVLEALALIGPYVFMVGFILLISLGTHFILVHGLPDKSSPPPLNSVEYYDAHIKDGVIQLSKELPKTGPSALQYSYRGYWRQLQATAYYVPFSSQDRWFASGLLTLFGIVALGGFFLACRVDVNLFSLHNFYQNRLVRCYLGASNANRQPDPFTAFDPADDLPLAGFTTANGYYGPYPIQNATLNVTSGGMLQYQERQAESFVFTPHYTGFSAETTANKMRLFDDPMGPVEQMLEYQDHPDTNQLQAHAYRPTSKTGGGISLGMGMAISGAAVNPNMGYHTSTAVAFLLTVFNVRLGWWLGNTLKNEFRNPGPPFGVLYMLQELVGMANANRDYVNLSDGGHFDNMGIYELVRRGCRYIICCDGEEDAKDTFEGIGLAIRKCRTDFNVDIDLPVTPLRKLNGVSTAHCTVGRIKYTSDESGWGYLLYMKASLTGDEPTDVLEYHTQKPEFPHQSTGDQWFDESQFESYRKLGYHIAKKSLTSLTLNDRQPNGRKDFFDSLFQIWYPATPALEEHTPAHIEMYARIFDEVRRDPTLASIDKDLFKGLSSSIGAWAHNGGHLCNGLIQLMERIFYDLNLEDRDTWEHPYVRGWINIFIHWTHSGAFRQAWAITQTSYPERFRAFYDEVAR